MFENVGYDGLAEETLLFEQLGDFIHVFVQKGLFELDFCAVYLNLLELLLDVQND